MWTQNGRRTRIPVYRVCSGDNTTPMLHADIAITITSSIILRITEGWIVLEEEEWGQQGTTNRWNPIYLNMEYNHENLCKWELLMSKNYLYIDIATVSLPLGTNFQMFNQMKSDEFQYNNVHFTWRTDPIRPYCLPFLFLCGNWRIGHC